LIYFPKSKEYHGPLEEILAELKVEGFFKINS
jgi:hypothetical protein